jgi:hypothetical protein
LSFSNQPVGFSFSYWVKKIGNGCISPRLFEFGNGASNNSWGSAWDNTGNLDYVNTVLSNNVWYHIVNTFDGTTLKTYLNGNLESSFPLNKTLPFGNNVAFGRMNHPAYDAFNGEMDDIGVWDRVITDCEIKDLYNSQLGSSNTTSSQTQTALDTYTWPVNNQTYTQSGTYSDTLVNAAGCDSIVTLNLTLSYTGINELSTSIISISPNPTNGDFTLTGLEFFNTISSMTIKDVNSKTIKELNPKATQFSLGAVKAGVYFLTITAGNKQEVVKLIKE